jgi:DNA-binding transcriptional ArsR family regulator
MVKLKDAHLDRTFAALSDPTRRALLAQLQKEKSLSVSELARPFAMSLPAIMKHLDVLSGAGLIKRTKIGRSVACELTAEPMEQAMEWLNRYQRYWSSSLDRLATFLEEEECQPDPTSPPTSPTGLPFKASRASRSGGGSTRAPKKSTQPGPTRKK